MSDGLIKTGDIFEYAVWNTKGEPTKVNIQATEVGYKTEMKGTEYQQAGLRDLVKELEEELE